MLRYLFQPPRGQQWLIRRHLLPTHVQTRCLLIRRGTHQRRHLTSISTVLLPPVIFGALVVALWTWKCFMMIVFQNKIIYMPGLPPNARRERIEDYKTQCRGIQWREERIRSSDGTRISLCVASVDAFSGAASPMKTIYILYFQGNASSLPPRLPFLSPVLRMLQSNPSHSNIRYVMVCASYRGYWTSQGRPSEKGIAKDADATLEWARHNSPYQSSSHAEDSLVVIWGQSIGAGIATNLAARQALSGVALKMLILETPFLSIRAMLETLYPQRWLPYRYLWPFLRNHLDSRKALWLLHKRLGVKAPRVLILEAGKDELVPTTHGQKLKETCRHLGIDVQKKSVSNALHTEVLARQEGVSAVVDAIREAAHAG